MARAVEARTSRYDALRRFSVAAGYGLLGGLAGSFFTSWAYHLGWFR